MWLKLEDFIDYLYFINKEDLLSDNVYNDILDDINDFKDQDKTNNLLSYRTFTSDDFIIDLLDKYIIEQEEDKALNLIDN